MSELNKNEIGTDAMELMDTVGKTVRTLAYFSEKHKSTIQDDLFLKKLDDIIFDLKQVNFRVVRYMENV